MSFFDDADLTLSATPVDDAETVAVEGFISDLQAALCDLSPIRRNDAVVADSLLASFSEYIGITPDPDPFELREMYLAHRPETSAAAQSDRLEAESAESAGLVGVAYRSFDEVVAEMSAGTCYIGADATEMLDPHRAREFVPAWEFAMAVLSLVFAARVGEQEAEREREADAAMGKGKGKAA